MRNDGGMTMGPIVDHRLQSTSDTLVLNARPEAIRRSPADTAVVVIDMQNAYASKGGYESVARMLDEMAEVPNTGGVLLTFDDFLEGVEAFGTRIQPLIKSRRQG
ncbi:alkanesulfonate monooxygenase SsuD/methylene tetrahydromethanopterin reductase-like flavin-dependent oxidoreductase (luciferase family) [Sphingomonas sp. SORGH_AS 879]|nr:alkanesulfonate monooxygenase SsuD/methylene tetrahydromethanopterin reductase-like flavin-dependent oxidoreductase (luciferase family) [Sphingomonas sp. SORGH_AS_0879]